MERMVSVDTDYQLWTEERGDARATPLLLVMGANAGGLTWPESLVDRLAEQHRVIRYDHRDTGRSTWSAESPPYAIRDLATDAVSVLDALGIDQAHVVGMSMGGVLVQMLLLDHPHRLRSATMFGSSALGTAMTGSSGEPETALPGGDPRLLALWDEMADERDHESEIAWRIEHWRLLNGDVLPFDPDEFRAREERAIAHAGTHRNPNAHMRADPAGLDRGPELAQVTVPTLVVDAPEDPVAPPPHAAHLAALLGGATRTVIPGMGHALSTPVLESLTTAILTHAESAEHTRDR